MGKKKKEAKEVIPLAVTEKIASEYTEQEQEFLICPDRFGKTENECSGCHKIYQLKDMWVEKREFEACITYNAYCPFCKRVYFTKFVDKAPTYPKLNPETDCPKGCDKKEDLCKKVTDCQARREAFNIPDKAKCPKCHINAWNYKGGKPVIIECRGCGYTRLFDNVPCYHEDGRICIHLSPDLVCATGYKFSECNSGVFSAPKPFEEQAYLGNKAGILIYKNCDKCGNYLNIESCKPCIWFPYPWLGTGELKQFWIERKMIHEFNQKCPYCGISNPGWMWIGEVTEGNIKVFEERCESCKKIRRVNLEQVPDKVRVKAKIKANTDDVKIRGIVKGHPAIVAKTKDILENPETWEDPDKTIATISEHSGVPVAVIRGGNPEKKEKIKQTRLF